MGAVPQGPPQAYPLPGRASMNLPPGHSGYGGMQGQFPGAPGSAGMQPAPYTPPGSGPGMTPMGYPAAPPQMGYPPNQGMNPYGVPPNAQPGAPPPGPNQSPYGAPQQPQGQNTPGYTQATAGGNQYYF
ncbi:hypothetical protein TRFO_17073 [Tritrichomonas foetus]|uniref:Uncharacterized protein n=1 Tax=Tritrichomonas foetus TaxID=1144522 RepID=A0A1J4KNR5_9EUKA|nr:hypothetical protein TRFO_17073 [Tritrichomonas foetus]|eukprot:OHT12919.1 hypothetical protein TRFO_17073 [Tritrichomonas foetus]